MELTELIRALSRPTAYPDTAGSVELRQTHISVVFLAGGYAYKIKKPVDMGFLDFSTLAKRRHFCEEEVRLNRRLAPSVYLGVVPVTTSAGGLRVEGEGDAVEWAVKMVRLPEDATLEQRLRRDQLRGECVESLARRVAEFHTCAETNEHIAMFGRFEIVARNTRENFDQSEDQTGLTISRPVAERLKVLAEESLERWRTLIDGRAAAGVIRDTHGDLRLDHVFQFPERPPPEDLVVVDCVEFNERFRYMDPVADMAFLVMDFTFEGRRDLAEAFADAYFTVTKDDQGRALLPFYTAYRAAVRGKVEGLQLREPEIPDAQRMASLQRARGHWLLALSELETPERRPCLVLVAGLPGAGKSTLSWALAERAGFTVIRSDVVRKERAGAERGASRADSFEGGIYTPEWTERTYAECLRRAESILFEGGRVIVDASFREEHRRRSFLEAAKRHGVPGVVLLCNATSATVRSRLAARRNDASDADWFAYLEMAKRWKAPGPLTRAFLHEVSTESGPETALHRALDVLRAVGRW